MKYLYAVHQVTPPAAPQLEMNIKDVWGLHIGKRGVEALTAEEEDMVDQTRAFSCKDFPDHPGELKPLVKPPPPNPNDTPLWSMAHQPPPPI